MTTVRQVKKLLTPLAARHDDLELVGFTLYIKPVRHLLRGVTIDRTGEAARFRVRWPVRNLCEPRERLAFTWAGHVYPNRLWQWSNPKLQDDLFLAIEEQALPALRAIQTLDDFFTFASNRERFGAWPFDLFTLQRVGVDCARGDLDSARAGCEALKSGLTRWSMASMRDDFDRVTGELCPLLAANDRAGMARLLHQWEAYTVEKLKIGHIYEPTPFPLELMPSDEGQRDDDGAMAPFGDLRLAVGARRREDRRSAAFGSGDRAARPTSEEWDMRAMLASVPLALLAATADAADAWEVYPFDRGGGTIAAVAVEDARSAEPNWRLAMTCRADADWDLAVMGVDAAVLGGAIVGDAEIEFLVIADADPDNTPVHAYYPRISFDQMVGEWAYSVPFGLAQIDRLAAAKALAVEGTGIAFSLPSEGAAEAFAEFRTLCAALPRDDE